MNRGYDQKGTGDRVRADMPKIWCDEKGGFQFIKACESNCKKKYKCKAYRDYIEPKLY